LTASATTTPHGVLCLHGLTGTPFEVQSIVDALAHAGHTVAAPLLSGHGQDPAALEATGWSDWMRSAKAAFDALVARVNGPVAIVGFSMGGLLALELAKAAPEQVAALAVLSAPLRLRRTQVSGIRLLSLVPSRLRRGRFRAIPKSLGSDVAHPDLRGKVLGLPAMPVRALESLLDLMATARVDLQRVLAPTLVVHGRHDHTVPIADSVELSERLGAATVERLWLENSFHLVGLDNDKQTLIDGIVRFFAAHARW
jgi:carboxylesterase